MIENNSKMYRKILTKTCLFTTHVQYLSIQYIKTTITCILTFAHCIYEIRSNRGLWANKNRLN